MTKVKACVAKLFRTPANGISRRDYLRLDMNENPAGLPEKFVSQILSEVDAAMLSSYPEYAELQHEIASSHRLKPENICISNGSDAAIKYIFDAYVSRGDSVLLSDPTFAMYPVYCKMFGAKAVPVPYNRDFSFPLERFCRLLTARTKLAVVVNPNNPTGTALQKKDLTRIIKKANRNGTLLIVDEAYFYFYPRTIIREIKRYDNLIVLRTFSKLCGMAGLRVGYAAASAEIIENLRKVKPTYDVNALSVLFARKILAKPDILRVSIHRLRRGEAYLAGKLRAHGIPFRKGRANFLLIRSPGKAREIGARLAEKGVLVGSGFAQDFLRDYVRVSISDEPMMREFWGVFYPIWQIAVTGKSSDNPL